MRRAMLFIDYENFDANRVNLYRKETGESFVPFIELTEFPDALIESLREDEGLEVDLLKTFLFVPKPDDFLIKEDWRAKRFNFLRGMDNVNYLSVIFGQHTARPLYGSYDRMKLEDKNSYYVVEKGTDVNIATQLLTKAFHNSFDVAIVVSSDTDYIPVYDVLDTLGKLVVVVGVSGQSLNKLKTHTDLQYWLNQDFFDGLERPVY